MSISLYDLEDDIMNVHNEVRENPDILIHELEYILDGKVTYYPPTSHIAMLIESGDLNEIVSWFFFINQIISIYFRNI